MAKAKAKKERTPRGRGGKGKGPPPAPPGPPHGPDGTPPDDDQLTDAERRFVDEYLVDRCSARAYRRTFPGCSHRGARNRGHEMRHRPRVDLEIRAAVAAQSVRTQVTADRALKEIARVAFSDVYDLYDPHTNTLYHPRNIPLEMRRAIASVRVSRTRVTTTSDGTTTTEVRENVLGYTLWDKLGALEKLCRYLGLRTEIPPLESLLAALPPPLAEQIRAALRGPGTPPPLPPPAPPAPPERVL